MNEINEQSLFDLARLRRYASPQNSNDQWYAAVINGLSGVDQTHTNGTVMATCL